MLKKVITGVATGALLAGLSGCGPAPIQVKPMSNLSVSDRTQILTLNFPKVDPVTGEKFIFDLNRYDFSRQIVNLSKYSVFHSTRSIDGVTDYKGLKVNKKLNMYILDYANGEKINRSWYLNSVKFTIFYKQLNNNQISFTLDDKYKYQPCSNAIGINIDPLDSLQNLEKDSKNILFKLKTLKITLDKRYHLKGDINSKYKADSIYANFKRLMGSYDWRSYYRNSVKKENTFNLELNNKNIPLHIEVYPYRDGSKVQYETYLPYTISSDGKVSLSKKDIEQLKTKISQVIND